MYKVSISHDGDSASLSRQFVFVVSADRGQLLVKKARNGTDFVKLVALEIL